MKIPFFTEIEKSRNVLIIGAGGGFDVFCGLPIYFWLKQCGKSVHLANLSFSELSFCDGDRPVPSLVRVTSAAGGSQEYFPEAHLSAWLEKHFGETPVYAIDRAGAKPVLLAYQWLVQNLQPDTLILVDGGTEFRLYEAAVEFVSARTPRRSSIVNSSIISAANGWFGNAHASKRTEGSELFINPLMALYWAFDLDTVARRNLYLDRIRNSETYAELTIAIEGFRATLPKTKPWQDIPC